MSTILFLQYNNYFNRIIKRETQVALYTSGRNWKMIQGISWNPNDGVDTQAIFNWTESWNPDYCIELNEDGEILTRWFIMEQVRTRVHQFTFSFHRDLLSDYYDSVLNAPCFVEKGWISKGNPLIYNAEGMAFNQIKKREILLRDNSYSAYAALYLQKGTISDAEKLSGTISAIDPSSIGATSIGTTYEQWSIYQNYISTGGYKNPIERAILVSLKFRKTGPLNPSTLAFNKDGNYLGMTTSTGSSLLYNNYDFSMTNVLSGLLSDASQSINQQIDTLVNPTTSLETITNLNNTLIYTSDGKYYRIHVEPSETIQETIEANDSHLQLKNAFINAFMTDGQFKDAHLSGSINNETFSVRVAYQKYLITATQETSIPSISYDLHGNFNVCENEAYDVICIPFYSNNTGMKVQTVATLPSTPSDNELFTLDFDISKRIISSIIVNGVSGKWLIDAQVIPFSPFKIPFNKGDWRNPVNAQRTDVLTNKQIKYIDDSTSKHKTYCLYLDSIRFTKDIYPNVQGLDLPTTDLEVKVDNETTFYRLCSPNYQGVYEFSKAKNGGIKFFNIDVTLIPYSPYIHVNPNFQGLYGQDFNDPRGLICSGDFSLSQTSDAWLSYLATNKNYENIFNRQIENMDVMNKYQHTSDVLGALVGAGAGAAAGAVAGSVIPGFGTAAGAIVGGAASLVGGVADVAHNQAKYRENRDYATDIHNYQLDNIKALPNSLTKVGSLNNNFKYYIILEEYSCTDEEKQILRNKITYDGMTINAIGNISDYRRAERTFIKGQIIRLEDIDEDYHLASEIYKEISKGVYL